MVCMQHHIYRFDRTIAPPLDSYLLRLAHCTIKIVDVNSNNFGKLVRGAEIDHRFRKR